MERRLAAIMTADVAGYSRLMHADEEGTLAALKGHLRELIEPKTAEHAGRFGAVLAAADRVFVTGVYSAGEAPVPGVTEPPPMSAAYKP